MDNYWGRRTFCLITGASRGIGRCIAVEFAKTLGKDSVILLVARSLPGLQSTKEKILSTRKEIKVSIASVDLGKPNTTEFSKVIQSCLKENRCVGSDFEHVMLVQNAASLGIKSGLKVVDIDDLQEIKDYYSFNLESFILLNSVFFKIFNEPDEQKQLRTLVHISSGGAVEPFKTWGLYCAGKAATDMLVKSIALESGIRCINWAPGCVNTDIYEEAVKYTADPELAKFFEEFRKDGKVLTCEQTVTKLMKVLSGQKYIKGEHVSYYDIPDV